MCIRSCGGKNLRSWLATVWSPIKVKEAPPIALLPVVLVSGAPRNDSGGDTDPSFEQVDFDGANDVLWRPSFPEEEMFLFVVLQTVDDVSWQGEVARRKKQCDATC